jgi:SAM-dependent methyltransferase
MKTGTEFFAVYAAGRSAGRVIDLGSMDVNGTLKSACPGQLTYIGVDMFPGQNVDIVLEDPYRLPFDTASVDIVLSTSAFEHCEMFWLLFIEALRILKPDGLFYLNCPSNGKFHRYPVDCWRLYPDSGMALIKWAHRNNFNATLLESFIDRQDNDGWNDFVAVFLKDAAWLSAYPHRIAASNEWRMQSVANCVITDPTTGVATMLNIRELTEDQQKLRTFSLVLAGTL